MAYSMNSILFALKLLNFIVLLTADANITKTIKPFRDAMLPQSQRLGDLVPGLGKVMRKLLDPLIEPKPVEEMETLFRIHKKNLPKREIRFQPRLTLENYHFDIDELASSGFDATKKTVVMIPGFRSEPVENWILAAKDDWIALHGGDINVMEVSWHDSCNGLYPKAVAHTILVARQLTIFLYYLYEVSGVSLFDQEVLSNIHLIGHSLGAHIAGFVGQDLRGRVGRITGLDPAGPWFEQFSANQRLDRSDARLVEVLHTNSGEFKTSNLLRKIPSMVFEAMWSSRAPLLVESGLPTSSRRPDPHHHPWYGIQRQIGHLDYYANNGSEQPGCSGKTTICDHRRAHDIYVDVLRYEATFSRYNGVTYQPTPQNLTGPHSRLLAFKAASYESFETGESFSLICNEFLAARLLDTNQILGETRATMALNTQGNCAVPLLDFTTPLEELIRELRFEHGVNFEPTTPDEPEARYYFKTSAGRLLGGSQNDIVGDQYLLRIYLTNENDQDRDGFRWLEPSANASCWCSLHVQMITSDDSMSTMELGHVRPSQIEIDSTEFNGSGTKQLLLAIPFVQPAGSEATIHMQRLLSILESNQEQLERTSKDDGPTTPSLASIKFSNIFRRLMPKSIVLTLHENKPIQSERPTCRLNVAALEIHPISDDHHQFSIGALYGYRLALGEQIPLTTSEQLVEHLQSQESQHNSATQLATSGRGAIKSASFGLESAIIHQWMI